MKTGIKALAVVFALLILASCSALAGGYQKVGWMEKFSIPNGQAAAIAACDGGYGTAAKITKSDVNIGIGKGGVLSGITYRGSLSQFVEYAQIWGTSTIPLTVSWQTFNWEPVEHYQAGDLWSIFSV